MRWIYPCLIFGLCGVFICRVEIYFLNKIVEDMIYVDVLGLGCLSELTPTDSNVQTRREV